MRQEDLLKLMRGDPRATDAEILAQNPDLGNYDDVPRVDGVDMSMPSAKMEMPEEAILAPDGPSLFTRVSDRLKTKQMEDPALTGNNGLAKQLASVTSMKRGPAETSASAPLLDMLASSKAAPADPYGNELNDAALKAAQAEAQDARQRGLIGRAASEIGAGIASLGGGKQVKIDNSFYDKLDEHSGRPEKDILTRRAGKDKELERQSALIKGELEQEKSNAGSFVSQTYREIARKLKPGLNIPDGVTAAQLETVLPVLKELAKKEMDEYQRIRLEQAWRRLEEGEKNRGLRERTQDWKEREKDELSDAQVKEVSAIDKTMGGLDDIAELKPAFNTGPIAGRVAAFQKTVGLDEAKRTAFKQKVGRLLASYIKEISGTAASDAERVFLTGLLPNENLSDAAFLESVSTFKKELYNSRSRLLESYRRQGKARGVESFASPNRGYKDELAKPGEKSSKPGPGSIVNVKGKRYKVAADGDSLEEI